MVVAHAYSQETLPPRAAAEDFAILAWSRVSDDPETLRRIHDCGFNLIGVVPPEYLDAVAEARLKAIVWSDTTHVDDGKDDYEEAAIAADVAGLVARAGPHPALLGYYLRDEPHAQRFPTLARYVAAFRQAAPRAHSFINLFPNYATPLQLGTATYDEYLRQFIETVRPPILSYDHYALMEDGSLRDLYFPNLEAVRAATLEHGIPFWNVVLSNAHFTYDEPSPAGLRFQAYTTLAYGGRGIGYFTYLTPTRGNYRLSPIDQFGHKTPTWDMLRNVNLQLHALAPAMKRLASVGVFHHPEVPRGCRALAESKHVAEVEGSGQYLIGEFENPDGVPHVMVVNKDLRESASFEIRFRQSGRIMHTNSYTGRTRAWRGESNWLAPGQGMLLSLDR
jgi:hypothetical protein